MDMGSLSATEAYIRKIQMMHDAMPSPSIIVSAAAAGLGGSNYLMDEVRNSTYHAHFPVQADYSALGKASYVPDARRSYVFGIAGKDAHLTSGADVLGYESWGTNGGMSSTYPNDRSLVFTGKSNLVKTFESFNGIIGSRHATLKNGFSLPRPAVRPILAPLLAWRATRMSLSAALKVVCICATGRQGFSSANVLGRAVTPNISWPWATRS
jgi:hypothetical protein